MAKESKKISTLSLSAITGEDREVPIFVEKAYSGKQYVSYGADNKFPEYLWDLYLRSSLTQSIINGTVDYICGGGTVLNPALNRFNDGINRYDETIDDVIKKCAVDYMIFGGYALQIIRNMLGEITEVIWLDARKIRTDAEETKYFYSDKWGSYGAQSKVYQKFDPEKKQTTAIYYFKGHITRGVYPVCKYNGALNSIETSCEIGKFHLNNILNNLSPSVIINFNSGQPSESDKKKIEDKVKEKLSGASKAGSFILMFNDSKEKATTIERLASDDFDKKFEALQNSTRKEIFVAFRATPALFGMNPENNGFSKEEFLESFELYNKTVVKPMQLDIVRSFNKIFNMDDSISFIPFALDEANKIEE